MVDSVVTITKYCTHSYTISTLIVRCTKITNSKHLPSNFRVK